MGDVSSLTWAEGSRWLIWDYRIELAGMREWGSGVL